MIYFLASHGVYRKGRRTDAQIGSRSLSGVRQRRVDRRERSSHVFRHESSRRLAFGRRSGHDDRRRTIGYRRRLRGETRMGETDVEGEQTQRNATRGFLRFFFFVRTQERSGLLRRWFDLVRRNRDDLARIITAEQASRIRRNVDFLTKISLGKAAQRSERRSRLRRLVYRMVLGGGETRLRRRSSLGVDVEATFRSQGTGWGRSTHYSRKRDFEERKKGPTSDSVLRQVELSFFDGFEKGVSCVGGWLHSRCQTR